MKTFSVSAPWKDKVPLPVFDEEPEWLELYWKAWELAHAHLKEIPGMPQTPYMDEAFCDTEIWIWDSCFMSLFCKYAPDVFPGVETLNNFYKPLYDNAKLPEIVTENAPAWTGYKIGQKAPIKIHIADNPPLFAWAELENALSVGNLEHLETLLHEKKYLQKHFAWIESLKERTNLKGVRLETCLINDGKGYFWEGGRSGMDNTPRGRKGPKAEAERPNNPRMLWVDAIAQQGLAALCIAKIAALCGDKKLEAEWTSAYNEKRKLVEELYWDEQDGCYYDVDLDSMKPMKTLTPASFWPLTAKMASPERARRVAKLVEDPKKLGGEFPWVSLSRDDADFNAEDGEYWRGAVWLPTAYAGLRGLANYGLHKTARESAMKLLRQMHKTFKGFAPHTIWECYSPNKAEPAMTCGRVRELVRKDFCGWSALGPIAIFIEHVVGVHSIDAFAKRVEWSLPEKTKGATGVKNLRFGGLRVDLLCENGVCQVETSEKFTLLINGKAREIEKGSVKFKLV